MIISGVDPLAKTTATAYDLLTEKKKKLKKKARQQQQNGEPGSPTKGRYHGNKITTTIHNNNERTTNNATAYDEGEAQTELGGGTEHPGTLGKTPRRPPAR